MITNDMPGELSKRIDFLYKVIAHRVALREKIKIQLEYRPPASKGQGRELS
jgi:hypothetical protein